MTQISIIIPIYKGKRYISYWLDIISKNMSRFVDKQKDFCELMFINDFPDETITIDDTFQYPFLIKVLNSDINRGIHGARVWGISQASGEYVVLFDQDDRMAEAYIISQYEKIGEHDAIVCNGYKESYCIDTIRKTYKDIEMQNCVKEYNCFKCRNYIESPGQVMLRKSMIPQAWLDNIMEKNGADDYFLWLLLSYGKASITINQDVLYTHVGHAGNTSSDIKLMNASIEEMLCILEKKELLPLTDITDIRKNVLENNMATEKYIDMLKLYDRWMYLKNRCVNIADFLIDNKYKKVVIYGMGYLGNRLYDELKRNGVEVLAAIDRDAERILHEIPVVKYGYNDYKKYLVCADAMIITINDTEKEIEHTIKKDFNIPIYTLNQIIIKLIENSSE